LCWFHHLSDAPENDGLQCHELPLLQSFSHLGKPVTKLSFLNIHARDVMCQKEDRKEIHYALREKRNATKG